MFLVWFIAGLLSLFGALVCAELASTFTQTGGVYVYLREAFSPALGFLWGWTLFWIIHSGIIAAIALVCARYLAYFVPIGETGMRAAAVAVIVFLSAVNYIGVRYGSILQSLFTLGKLIAIAGIVVLGAFLGSRAAASPPAEGSLVSGTGDFTSAIIAAIFAFGGWHMVTFNAEETINPRKTIPRALIIGMLIVMASYIALNAVYVYVLPLDKVASSTRIAADAADAILGFGGGATMAGLAQLPQL
jgi:APA family basic amino acid/polyamine antiporter